MTPRVQSLPSPGLARGVLFGEDRVEARLRDKASAYRPKTAPLKLIVAEVTRSLEARACDRQRTTCHF